MNFKIHHVGYLVKNIQKAISKFQSLGYEIQGRCTHDTYRLIDICFLQKDSYYVELVSPFDSKSIVSNLMRQYKNSPYHICYSVENIEQACDELKKEGFVIMQQPAPAPAINDKRVVFLMSHVLGIIELVEQ